MITNEERVDRFFAYTECGWNMSIDGLEAGAKWVARFVCYVVCYPIMLLVFLPFAAIGWLGSRRD